MKSWLGMVSMLQAGGRGGAVVSARGTAPGCTQPWGAVPPPPHPANRHLLWLRFSTSMFLAFSSSRGHSVSWL